jgi:hypothetical protein
LNLSPQSLENGYSFLVAVGIFRIRSGHRRRKVVVIDLRAEGNVEQGQDKASFSSRKNGSGVKVDGRVRFSRFESTRQLEMHFFAFLLLLLLL